MCAVSACYFDIDFRNKQLLKFHQLNLLTDISAFWNFAVRLDEGDNFFTAGHLYVKQP